MPRLRLSHWTLPQVGGKMDTLLCRLPIFLHMWLTFECSLQPGSRMRQQALQTKFRLSSTVAWSRKRVMVSTYASLLDLP